MKEDLEPAKEKINLFVRSITSLCSGFSLLLVPSFLAFEELHLSGTGRPSTGIHLVCRQCVFLKPRDLTLSHHELSGTA